MEDIMFLMTGYRSRGFSTNVSPCGFSAVSPARNAAAEWLRTAFHDMATANVYFGTGGLDASIMFETERGENIGAAFNTTLSNMSPFYNSRASVSDLIALGVYTSVRVCGGPLVPIRVGRVDATVAGSIGVPEPQDSLYTFENQFSASGFNTTDMIQMTACGHTLGGVHSADFPQIVPAGTVANDYQFLDTTEKGFDNKVVTEYIASNTTNPLVVGPAIAAGRASDVRVYGADKNVTMQALTDPTVFRSTCASILQRMIDVVPPNVNLTDPMDPYEVKPVALQLTLQPAGSTIAFSGEIRIRTTVRSQAQISEVQLLYKDRNGAATCGDCTIDTAVVGTATGFDENFTASLLILNSVAGLPNSAIVLHLFRESILNQLYIAVQREDHPYLWHHRTARQQWSWVSYSGFYHASGSSKLSSWDAVNSHSCEHKSAPFGAIHLTTSQVLSSSSSKPGLRLYSKVARQGAIVPLLTNSTIAMIKGASVGPYDIYSVSSSLDLSQSTSAKFDVLMNLGSDTMADAFKDTANLASPSASSTGWTALGCYADLVSNGARVLPYGANVPGGSQAMTNELCQSTCHSLGYVLAGTEYSGECYCGNTLQNGGGPAADGDAECDMTCNGNAQEICGGPARLTLFEFVSSDTSSTSPSAVSTSSSASTTAVLDSTSSSSQTPTTVISSGVSAAPSQTAPALKTTIGAYEYYGCQTEATNMRALSSASTANDSMTLENCAEFCAGYTYWGVEYGRECYCGNAFNAGSIVANATDCSFLCPGNSLEYCGAGDRLSTYNLRS
ncbi:MAG: hypothetical protein M1818_006382 [Claussenomyces sp. TS43310]|nr:MAG: hypothetical protein M1818_006382 [Claussenomyces sp. TS43310]